MIFTAQTRPRHRRPANKIAALLFALLALSLLPRSLCAAASDAPFVTPLESSTLDPAAFSDWVDGAEHAIILKEGPQWAIWTRKTEPGHNGVSFGDSKTPGKRHLRIGLTAAIPVGSVLVKAGGQLSVLKPNAAYPGDMGDESMWLPAQRIRNTEVTGDEVAGRGEFAIWVLPPGTTTRALRFSHVAAPADKEYAGWLGGALVLADRLANIAPQALASAGSRNEAASLLNNNSDDNTWKAWDNGKDGAERIVSPEHPEWIMLVWPRAVPVRGLNAIWAGFASADVQVYTGPPAGHPREAAESDWQTVGTFDKIEHHYPRTLGVNWLDFGKVITTRAHAAADHASHRPCRGTSQGKYPRRKARVARRTDGGSIAGRRGAKNCYFANG